MAINLKEILISDVDNIKLDKVNYNFDQLVANGGGPQGFQGNPGDTGYQGVTGYQGNQGITGDIGETGNQGSNGQLIWKINTGSGLLADTILPIIDSNGNAPSVLIGYKTTDSEYSSIEQRSQLVINRHSNFNNNLELKTVGLSTIFAFKLDADLQTASGNSVMDMSFIGGKGTINQYADLFTWGDPSGSAGNLISLDSTVFHVKPDLLFQKDVKIDGELRILSGSPDVNKVAVSENASGKVVFKTVAEIGGAVPIGTIVSMLPQYFEDNSKFVNQHTAISPASDAIEIYVGRGIGEYEGWYICNGMEWTNGTPAGTFSVPDLNSFSYDISDDTDRTDVDSQGLATLTENNIPIIGGSNASLNATYNNSTTLFDVTGTLESSDTLLQSNGGATATTYIIKKLPQIIYLGVNDLTWGDNGSGAGNVAATYTFLNWTGIGGGATVQQGGVVNISLGSESNQYYVPPQSITIVPTSFSANTSNSSIQRTIDTTITVPSGFSNAGQTVNGTLNANQPTNYNPGPFTSTLTASPDSNQGNTGYDAGSLPTVVVSYTSNQGDTSTELDINMELGGNYYRSGTQSTGIIFSNAGGDSSAATLPSYQGTNFITNTTGYQNIDIGEIWKTFLTIGSGNLNATIEYEFTNAVFLNRDDLVFKVTTPNVDWSTTYETSYTPTGSANSVYSIQSNRLYCTGLPYREVTVRLRTAYNGSGTTPNETSTYTLSESTATNVGAVIQSESKSIDSNGDHINDITLRTGLGDGTFFINVGVTSTGSNSGGGQCQSYKVYPHTSGNSVTVNYTICGGSSTQITVASNNTVYICTEVGATNGADYYIVSGNSNDVTVDTSGQNNCLTQIP